MARLEWAFAGTSNTTLTDKLDDDGNRVPHCEWKHWIDSNTNNPGTDEGDMYTQPDGKTLERGEMVNPATGTMQAYEELWRDEEVHLVPGEDKKWSVVLVLQDEVNGVKGMVVRIGKWCQGILKVVSQGEEGNEISETSVERWLWVDGSMDGSNGNWKRVMKLGRLFLPCSLTFEPERIADGSQIAFGDYKWVVEETFSW